MVMKIILSVLSLLVLVFLIQHTQIQSQTLGIGGGSTVAVAAPVCSPSQGIINNFIGFETQGEEEATFASLETYPTSSPRSGNANLSLSSGNSYDLEWAINADSGNDYIFGVAIKVGDKTPTSNETFLTVTDNAGSVVIALLVTVSGDVNVFDGTVTIRTITDPFVEGVYQFWEVYFQHLESGNVEVFIDGVSQGEDTQQDLSDGNPLSTNGRLKIDGPSGITAEWEFDDLYILSGVSSATDCFGNAEVFMYQNTAEDATDVGSPLDDGTWALVSETPVNEGASNTASYTTASAIGGTTTDEGARSGPSGDPRIDGDSNIKAAKSVHRLKRGNGSGTDHVTRLGNNVDGMTNTSVSLTTAFDTNARFVALTESPNIVPLSTEFFQIGFGRADAGGRDIIAGDQWAMLLHVPN